MESRERVFQQLKPVCVALNESASTLSRHQPDIRNLTARLENLAATLNSVPAISNGLDVKLADYVFFPLSNVLKGSKILPIHCLDLALQCIECLIKQGWKQNLQPELAAQLIILSTLLAERHPQGLSFSTSTNELMASAFDCIHAVFSISGCASSSHALLTGDANFPQLGQTVTVMLEGVSDATSPRAQISASSALEAFVANIHDREVHASFLPGIASKIAHILRPQTNERRSFKVLISCLNVLRNLLQRTMGPDTSSIEYTDSMPTKEQTKKETRKSIITNEWQMNAATQLKPTLNSVFRLKAHDRSDVKEALVSLCLMLLRDCGNSLPGVRSMALETLLAMSAQQPGSEISSKLENILRSTPALAKELSTTFYDRLQSLVTVMQGSSTEAQIMKLQEIGVVYAITMQSDLEKSTIERSLAIALKDSVAAVLRGPQSDQDQISSVVPVRSLDLILPKRTSRSVEFTSLSMVRASSQRSALQHIEILVKQISQNQSRPFVAELARSFDLPRESTDIGDFWLLLTVVQQGMQTTSIVDFLTVPGSANMFSRYLEDLYSISLNVLGSSGDGELDRRLSALALRTLALRAKVAGTDFRVELVDALYPVLHALATPDDDLQQDSITTLEVLASACEYPSVEQLIVDNADYLTNAIALKLNAFDVSPQAPQVLLMMLRLAGPGIIPYLEDTIESIFAALEDYHGYPMLVELLFRVLAVTAEEGVKTPQLAITDEAVEANLALRERWQPSNIADLATLMRDRSMEEAHAKQEPSPDLKSHPQRPWKGVANEAENETDDEQMSDKEDERADEVEPLPPAPKSYNLLLKITDLTQHFLPTASASLRLSLLGLIKTTVPAIAKHENSFLPLINTLWPEVVSRLDDREPYVVATTLDVIAILCEYAVDFMRTRITQLWSRLLEIFSDLSADILRLSAPQHGATSRKAGTEQTLALRATKLKQAVAKMEAYPADYADTLSRQLWTSLINAFAVIIEHISLSPELFDEALHMLEPALNNSKLRSAFEVGNSDALWLADVRSGSHDWPIMPDERVSDMWHFVEVPG